MKRSFNILMLILCTTLLFSGCSENSGSSGDSAPLTVNTIPASVTGLTAAPASGQAVISWQTFTGATSYNIYWSTTSGVTKTTGTRISGINSTSYTHTGLTNSTTYYYVVTAQTDAGESIESTEISALTSEQITAYLYAPAPWEGKLALYVKVSSTYQINGVTAHVENAQVDLAYYDIACGPHMTICGPTWLGTMPLTGLTRGNHVLTVTATDYFGNTSTASATFFYDLVPNLVITEPISGTVVRQQLHIAASCSDDDPAGCRSLTVKIGDANGNVLTSGQTSIDEVVSLIAYEGTSVRLTFIATDSAYQETVDSRTLFIESSTKLIEIANVPGNIWDVQPDRILFLDTSTGGNILKIRDRYSGLDTVVMGETGKIPQYGFLTTKGAIFEEQIGDSSTSSIYEWRDGALLDLANPGWHGSLKVKGDYAIWSDNPLLIRRDLVSGASTTLSASSDNQGEDIASNGDVVYNPSPSPTSGSQIFLYRGGVTTQLTNDTLENLNPLTDGINIIYLKCPLGSCFASEIALFTAAGESILAPSSYDPSYAVNNGWAAFTKPALGGTSQVWLRSPAGDLTQVSFFSTSSSIDTLGPNGDLMWTSGKRRYLSVFGAQAVNVGSSLGRSIYQAGQWYVIIGGSLFSIEP